VTNTENVMHPTVGIDTIGFVVSQAAEMREHCFMRGGCSGL
jgi:hypothetical protein